MDRDGRTRLAARNNAHWCHVLCRTHGLQGRYEPGLWSCPERTPPSYPDAVTLDVGQRTLRIADAVDSGPGWTVKDSFADVDLRPVGLEVLFEATWVWRDAGGPAPRADGDVHWQPVRDAADLRRWEVAWDAGGPSAGLFRPGLLDAADVVVLGGYADGEPVAGAVLNRTGPVLGLSNVFGHGLPPAQVWAGCVGAALDVHPGLALVGYEAGAEERAAARSAGFEELGPLRVWG
jgi:hypothetical protein